MQMTACRSRHVVDFSFGAAHIAEMRAILLVCLLSAACRATGMPEDAGIDAADSYVEDAAPDALPDGDVIAPDGGCWAEAPNAVCEHVTASEATGTSPYGPSVTRYETTEARAELCPGRTWTITRCGYTDRLQTPDGSTETEDAGCDVAVHLGGLARIVCGTRLTYTAGGELRTERVTAWDTVEIAQ